MKRLLVAMVMLVLLAGGGYWLVAGRNATVEGQNADQGEQAQDPLAKAVTLAIKGVSLMQGEKGIEFWRLKASWAGMHQEDGVVDVREPNVRYTLGDGTGDDFVHAISHEGRITDNQRVLTMWGDVRLSRGEDIVTGPRLVYKADERILHFPDGAQVDNPKVTGHAGMLSWNMAENRIDGSHGVDLLFSARDSSDEASAAAARQGN